MLQIKGNRKLFATMAVLALLLAVIVGVALIKVPGQNRDPYASKDKISTTTEPSNTEDSKVTEQQPDTANPESATPKPTAPTATPDPTTVSSIDIAPMNITVSYVKGIGGFEYQVLKTTNGTRYIELSSTDLVGTKCTNDKGVFASILADPNSNESTTLAKTTTIDGTKYGLSLEPSTCTGNVEKLQSYQKSFGDAYSLLKKMG